MSKATPSAVPSRRVSTEPQRALLTPSASPSVGPPDRPPTKRPRLRSTPSSIVSATPSASNESTSSNDVNSARRASTLRVLNVWSQLAERYNKRLDEDDIVDLHSCAIITDRGVLKSAAKDYHFGHISQPDGDQDFPDAEQDLEDSEQDDDEDELNTLPPSEAGTDDDPPISKTDLLRGVAPLSVTTDADDLKEFLEAEKRRRELAGDEDDEDDMSPEELAALREAMEEERQKTEAAIDDHVKAVLSAHGPRESEVDATPKRASTRPPESDYESEDELAVWTHDESTAVYPVAHDESTAVHSAVHDEPTAVHPIAGAESEEDESDREFESILTRPPPRRPRSPVAPRKPEVLITQKKKRSVSKEKMAKAIDDEKLDEEVVGHRTKVKKGKGKQPCLEEVDRPTAKSKSPGVPSRGQKRKRVASSSTISDHMPQSPELESIPLGHDDSSSVILPQPDSPKLTSGKDVTTPARFESAVAGPSRLSSSFTSTSKPQRHTFPSPEYTPFGSEPIPPPPHEYDYNTAPLSSSPLPLPPLHHTRHPSHPPPIYPSPHSSVTPGPSLPGHPPPPMDPAQTQQAHYLLAQAMQQLSYLISALPPYPAYPSSPGQPWQAPSHTAYSTPLAPHPPHLHGARAYHTPSSSLSHSVLPPSSPSVSPPVEESRARSRGRSKSRGRRVSFKLDDEEITRGPQHTIHPELYDSQQKAHKQVQDPKQGKGKGKISEGSDHSLRLEGDLSDVPPREVSRGRTPGPPNRDKILTSRGRSLGRR